MTFRKGFVYDRLGRRNVIEIEEGIWIYNFCEEPETLAEAVGLAALVLKCERSGTLRVTRYPTSRFQEMGLEIVGYAPPERRKTE